MNRWRPLPGFLLCLCLLFALCACRSNFMYPAVMEEISSPGNSDVSPLEDDERFRDLSTEDRYAYTAQYFLRRLTACDEAALLELLCDYQDPDPDPDTFAFLRDIRFDGFEIVQSVYEDGGYLDVTVDIRISRGSGPLFKRGKQTYRFLCDNYDIFDFYPAENWEERRTDSDAAAFCHAVAAWMPFFETIDDFNTTVPDSADEGAMRSYGWLLMSVLYRAAEQEEAVPGYDGYMAYSRRELLRQADRLLGIDSFDVRYCGEEYMAGRDVVLVGGHGGHGYVHSTLSSGQNGDTHDVVISYSSDSAGLASATRMRYVVRELGDGQYRLESTQKLFDNGRPLYQIGH